MWRGIFHSAEGFLSSWRLEIWECHKQEKGAHHQGAGPRPAGILLSWRAARGRTSPAAWTRAGPLRPSLQGVLCVFMSDPPLPPEQGLLPGWQLLPLQARSAGDAQTHDPHLGFCVLTLPSRLDPDTPPSRPPWSTVLPLNAFFPDLQKHRDYS